MRLLRVTDRGKTELDRFLLEHQRPPRGEEAGEDWFEEVQPPIEMGDLPERIAGLEATPEREGEVAVLLHRELRLPPRVAADPGVWMYLSGVLLWDYTQRRWRRGPKGDVRVRGHRWRGDIAKNALGRLWWLAEKSRIRNAADVARALGLTVAEEDDPYLFTRRIFESQAYVHELVNFYGLLTPTFAAAFPAAHASLRETAESHWVKGYLLRCRILFSSVCLDAFDGDPPGPGCVDPEAAVRLRDFLLEFLAPDARVAAREIRHRRRARSLLARLLGREGR